MNVAIQILFFVTAGLLMSGLIAVMMRVMSERENDTEVVLRVVPFAAPSLVLTPLVMLLPDPWSLLSAMALSMLLGIAMLLDLDGRKLWRSASRGRNR